MNTESQDYYFVLSHTFIRIRNFSKNLKKLGKKDFLKNLQKLKNCFFRFFPRFLGLQKFGRVVELGTCCSVQPTLGPNILSSEYLCFLRRLKRMECSGLEIQTLYPDLGLGVVRLLRGTIMSEQICIRLCDWNHVSNHFESFGSMVQIHFEIDWILLKIYESLLSLKNF